MSGGVGEAVDKIQRSKQASQCKKQSRVFLQSVKPKEMVRKKLAHLLGFTFMLLNLAHGANGLTRHDFPSGFIFGSSTSAYQVEGAAFEDGRKASIFDTFAHSGQVLGNGDVTADEYHRYKEDVKLMAETGLDAYRFSISWSRLLPDGRGRVNPKALEYYNNLVNELISNGIQPHATLMHLDVPQILEDEYAGFLNRRIIEDFTAYADVCFREFGDRIQYWTTINEPNIFILGGYDAGNSPPSRCSPPTCSVGNSTEPYIAAHNVLLAHASVARLYKAKYQAKQQGYIGFSLYTFHFIPYTSTREDAAAAQRSYDFFIGWFMHPLMYGDYPKIMRCIVGTRLPIFSTEESKLVKAINGSVPLGKNPYPNMPWGLKGVLDLFKQVYNNPAIYIYENGQVSDQNESINDRPRAEYLQGHIGGLLDAVRKGSNTKGYFVWSFVDVFELLFGYEYSFGLYYINFTDPKLIRYPKLSQSWYSEFLKGGIFAAPPEMKDINHLNLLTQLELRNSS